MAQGNGFLFNNFKHQLMEGVFNLLTDTVKVALVYSASPNRDSHTVWSDLSGQEVADGGVNYAAGGATLGNKTVIQNDTDDRGEFDGDNVLWNSLLLTTPANATPSHAVMYSVTAGNKLIACWEVTTVTNGGNYTLQWGTTGIALLT